jgi:hypothetical protein
MSATGEVEMHQAPACEPIIEFVKPHMIGVEIGVFKCDSTILFLEKCKYMYLIDPCRPYEGNPDTEYFADPKFVSDRLSRFAHTFYQSMSKDVAHLIPDVDFVFVDGNHTLEYVQKDLELYYPKIKPGGFMAGHDYDAGHPGVQQAVMEFFIWPDQVIEHYGRCWLVRK